jgi:hypothetical protein
LEINMKFKIRDGFVVNRVDYIELADGKRVERTTNQYAAELVDFDAAQAAEHLHQLEPVDKEAQAFVKGRFVPSAEATQVAGAIGFDLQALVAEGIKAGVAAALANVPAIAAANAAAADAASSQSTSA